jgi:hypothetical protein
MRYRPARYRNGYHRTRTKAQRRNRWLLYVGLALLTLVSYRCAVWWSRPRPIPVPAPMGKLV